jgi:hypothetical protein
MISDKVILNKLIQVPEQLGEDLKQSLIRNNRVATGETNRQIESIQTVDSAQLVAPDYIEDLEFGKKAGSRSDYGSLDRWIRARGLQEEWTPKDLDNHIFKFGWEGTKGVISEPLSDKNINDYLDINLEQLAIMIETKITDSIK